MNKEYDHEAIYKENTRELTRKELVKLRVFAGVILSLFFVALIIFHIHRPINTDGVLLIGAKTINRH